MKPASWGSELLDLLLPAGCVACRDWIPGGRAAPLVCGRCSSRLREAPWPRCPRCHHPRVSGRVEAGGCTECGGWSDSVTSARHAVVLTGPAEDLVHALKYEGWPELADLMGSAMARALARYGPERPGPSLVVPVPTSADRLRSRGYNQAELLARRVAEETGLGLACALERRAAGRSQTGLTPAERAENVRGAFRAVEDAPGRIRGAHIVLVDDVLTTGSTASEAASVLAETGAATVTLLTYGRALADAPERAR